MTVYLQKTLIYSWNNDLIERANSFDDNWIDPILTRIGFISVTLTSLVISVGILAISILFTKIRAFTSIFYWIWYSTYRKLRNINRQITDIQSQVLIGAGISFVGSLNPRWADKIIQMIHAHSIKRSLDIITSTQKHFDDHIQKIQKRSDTHQKNQLVLIQSEDARIHQIRQQLKLNIEHFSEDLLQAPREKFYPILLLFKRQCDAFKEKAVYEAEKII